MKLPNGFGSIHKLSGNRRNPYRVRVTTGWERCSNGSRRQKYLNIGYFQTKAKALIFLTHYNENPYNIKCDEITFKEIYEKWSKEHFEKIVPSAIRVWKAAYIHSKPLYNMKFKEIRVAHLEGAISDANVGSATKARMKSLYNMMYRYAMKHEVVDKNYATFCDGVTIEAKIKREPFTKKEIDILWEHKDEPFVNLVLIGIYSGWRPQELISLNKTQIDLKERIMTGGIKTRAGKERVVPIHDLIYDLVANIGKNEKINYDQYRRRFQKIMKKLNMTHRPHDTRHTFITKAKESGMNEYILKRIVGHAIKDITENIYTHRSISELKKEMKKIKE